MSSNLLAKKLHNNVTTYYLKYSFIYVTKQIYVINILKQDIIIIYNLFFVTTLSITFYDIN